MIIGNSYGAGNYAMCGKAYDPRLIVAWPSAALAVMSGNSAAKVLLQIETASLKKKGETITPEKEAELFDEIKSRYDAQVSPYYAALDCGRTPLLTLQIHEIGSVWVLKLPTMPLLKKPSIWELFRFN